MRIVRRIGILGLAVCALSSCDPVSKRGSIGNPPSANGASDEKQAESQTDSVLESRRYLKRYSYSFKTEGMAVDSLGSLPIKLEAKFDSDATGDPNTSMITDAAVSLVLGNELYQSDSMLGYCEISTGNWYNDSINLSFGGLTNHDFTIHRTLSVQIRCPKPYGDVPSKTECRVTWAGFVNPYHLDCNYPSSNAIATFRDMKPFALERDQK